MQMILPSAFHTQPWKNGGGITHEIAREDRDGALLWRLSIAEVASDGPFSAFTGLSRILTVIEGAGLHLHSPDGRLDALPLRPLAFSGGLAIESRMIDGPIRDFNVIFDGNRLAVSVTLVNAPRDCPATPGRRYAWLALAARTSLDGRKIPIGSVVLFEQSLPLIAENSGGLLVTFEQKPTN